ncbi:MAG: hypothetical protein A2Y07_11405 [Planctomycetes bacterium GWF2_50_10]|nr:MAG: hypothetical protein A2Y07_11405 [Planctomycetes bacterium GWF2_50_10]
MAHSISHPAKNREDDISLEFAAELISAKLQVDAVKYSGIKRESRYLGQSSSCGEWLTVLIKSAARRLKAAARDEIELALAGQFKSSWDGILSEFESEQIGKIGKLLVRSSPNVIHSIMLLG